MSCRVRIFFLSSLFALTPFNAYAADKEAQSGATQASSASVASEPSGSVKAAVGGVVDWAKGVADMAKQVYHGAADVGKKVGSDAAEVGKETGKKAKETFTK